MNSQSLYEAIGKISDKYVEEALEEKVSLFTRKNIKLVSSLAAVLVIVIALSQLISPGGQIVFNDLNVVNAKEATFDLSDAKVEALSFDQAKDYMVSLDVRKAFDDLVLFSSLTDLAYDMHGEIIYDRFEFEYISESGQVMSIVTARTLESKKRLMYQNRDIEYSMVSGKKVLLGKYLQSMGNQVTYVAEFEVKGNYVYVTARGVNEDEFVSVVEKLIN